MKLNFYSVCHELNTEEASRASVVKLKGATKSVKPVYLPSITRDGYFQPIRSGLSHGMT